MRLLAAPGSSNHRERNNKEDLPLWSYPLVNIQKTMERSTMFNGKIHYKWSFSIAMLNYQRVKHMLSSIGFCLFGFKSLFYLHIVRYFLEQKTLFIPSPDHIPTWLSAVKKESSAELRPERPEPSFHHWRPKRPWVPSNSWRNSAPEGADQTWQLYAAWGSQSKSRKIPGDIWLICG